MGLYKGVGGEMFIKAEGNFTTISKTYTENSGSIFQQGNESFDVSSKLDIHSNGHGEKKDGRLASGNEKKVEIYLTFDDGIQEGTEEVLKLLSDIGVKATFFLTGIHLWYAFQLYPDRARKILIEIYEKHAIGNHSFYHANDHYKSFYRSGGVKTGNKDSERLSVAEDFEKNKNQINYYLEKCGCKVKSKDFPLSKSQTIPLARFPGTNTWYADSGKDKIVDISLTDRGDGILNYEHDTEVHAKALNSKKYKIFGWDCEWKMGFDFSKEAGRIEQRLKQKGLMDYTKIEMAHPHFDMYNPQNLKFDRVNETVFSVKNKLVNNSRKTQKKTVLLMHERAFRKGKKFPDGKVNLNDSSEVDKLKELILYFTKNESAVFKTLDKY